MLFRDTIENFLATISDSSKEAYRLKLEKFYDYVNNTENTNDDEIKLVLESYKIEQIIKCLEVYIKDNEIQSKSIAWHFASVIKSYFVYLYDNGFRNKPLLQSFGLGKKSNQSYQFAIEQKINSDKRLDEVDGKKEISHDEINILVAVCDQTLKELTPENFKNFDATKKKNKQNYKKLIGALIFKLMIYSGVKYSVIRDLKQNAIDLTHNLITINGFAVRAPSNLGTQIAQYLRIKAELRESEDFLFVDAQGDQLPKATTYISDVLNQFIFHMDVTGIIKYSIIEMIGKEMNQSIIQSFTGVGNTIFKYCQKKVNSEKNSDGSRYLNSKLSSMELFAKL